jgi:hypothetical protein
MKVIEKHENNRTNKVMVISHRFESFPNIVCSGVKLYQLPCQIGKRCFQLKEIKPKYHQGSVVFNINSKRINVKRLRENARKVTEEFLLETTDICPF